MKQIGFYVKKTFRIITIEKGEKMDELNQISMQIILHAGDARTLAMKAMDILAEFKFDEAEDLLKQAKEELTEAHRVHTGVLQNAIANEENTYTVLFAHAQDTLMGVTSEINLIEKTYNLMKSVDQRLSKLEKGEN